MRKIFPPRLKAGDTVAVVAPSGSDKNKARAELLATEKYLNSLRLKVVYGKHLGQGKLPLDTPDKSGRLQDLHWAFGEGEIAGVFFLTGGWHLNQILPDVDWDLIKHHPKVVLGHSDGAIFLNAMLAKTGVVGYYGGNFSALGATEGADFTHKFLKKCLLEVSNFELESSGMSYDKDFREEEPQLKKHKSGGWWAVQKGIGQGTIIGGNLSSVTLLNGSKHMPSYKNAVLAVEMYRGSLAEFDRMLEAILQQPKVDKLEALLVGRFVSEAEIKKSELEQIIKAKPQLQGVPIVANLDFGHTLPRLTLPIGGEATVRVGSKTEIIINEH